MAGALRSTVGSILLTAAWFALAGAPVLAQGTSTISGTVINANSRGPIEGAEVQLLAGDQVLNTAASDVHGSFSFPGIAPGSYAIRTSAAGLQPSTSAPFTVLATQNVVLSVELQPVSTSSLRTIGSVTVGSQNSVSKSSTTITTITSTEFVQQGINQVQTALDQLPGVTIEHYDNGAPGAVTTLAIRGAGGFVGGSNTGYEVLVLQDGEPLRNGQYGDFDLSALTPSIYQRAELIKGVGGTSLFGANTIGGTLNLVTRDPTQSLSGDVLFGSGTYNYGTYNVGLSDTIGRFGFVLDAHQYGETGAIPAAFIADYAPYGCSTPSGVCDLSIPTQTINLKSLLAKLKYSFSDSTSLTIGTTQENDWRDQLGLIGNPTTVGGASVDPHGFPYFYGFPTDYVWNNQPKYFANLHTELAGGDLLVNYYTQNIQRVVNGLSEPPDVCCFLSRSVDRLSGIEALYQHVFGNNSVTAGVGGNSDAYFSGEASSPVTFEQLPITASATEVYRSYLLRDDYAATPKLNLSLTGYYSDYDVLNVHRFDPRFAVVFTPDNQTAFRASVGTGFGPPQLSAIVMPLDLNGNDASSVPQCPTTNQYCVASTGNPGLTAESGVGYEFGAQRNFLGRGSLSLAVYRTNVYGHIFDALEAAPPNLFFSDSTPTNPHQVLFISKPVNLSEAIYQGIELTTAIPIPVFTEFRLDGYYNTQAAYPEGLSTLTQSNIQNVVNGQQFQGVPLHKYGYGFDYTSKDNRYFAFMSGVFYANNNAYNLPSFWLWNAGVTLSIGEFAFHFTDQNMFNVNAFLFLQFNGGVPYNGFSGPYALSSYPVQPHQFQFTVERHFGAWH